MTKSSCNSRRFWVEILIFIIYFRLRFLFKNDRKLLPILGNVLSLSARSLLWMGGKETIKNE